jgi:hypothetical protein
MLPRCLIVTAVNELPPHIYENAPRFPGMYVYVRTQYRQVHVFFWCSCSIDESSPADSRTIRTRTISALLSRRVSPSSLVLLQPPHVPASPSPVPFSNMHRYFALAVVLAASTWASASVEFEDGFVGELTGRALLPNDDVVATLRRRAPCNPGQYYTTRCRQCTAGNYCPDGQVRILAWGFDSRLKFPSSTESNCLWSWSIFRTRCISVHALSLWDVLQECVVFLISCSGRL